MGEICVDILFDLIQYIKNVISKHNQYQNY